MEKAILKPTKEIMRDPITRIPLKKEGELKPLNTFWRRRLLAGDVEKVGIKKKSVFNKSEKSEKENN